MNTNDKIKNALDVQVPDWDDNEVWLDIESRLDKKSDKGFMWMWIGLFFIVGTTAGLLINRSANESITELSDAATITKELNVNQTQDINSKATSIDLAKGLSQSEKEQTATTENNKSKSTAVTSVNSESPISNTVANTSRKSIEFIKPTAGIIETLNNYSSSNALDKTAYATAKQSNSLINNEVKLSPRSVSAFEILLSPPTTQVESNTSLTLDLPSVTPYPSIEPLSSNHAIGGAEWLVITGYGLTSRNVAGPEEWLELKNNNESIKETVELNILYSLPLTKHLFINSGIGIRKTVEILESTETQITETTVASDTALIINATPIPGELNQTIIENTRFLTPNRFTSISIPIQLRYRLPLNHFSLDFWAGADIDMLTFRTGKAIATNLQVQDIQTLDVLYNNNIGLAQLEIGINGVYNINDNWSILGGIQYTKGIRNAYALEGYSSKYDAVGLNLGMGFKF